MTTIAVPTGVTPLPPPPGLAALRPAPAGPRRTLLALAALAVVVGVVALGGLQLVRPGGPTVPDHPQTWDPRVAELVRFVEHERGLLFRYPVYVDFVPADRLAAGSDLVDPGATQRQSIATNASRLRALGLLAGDVDLLAVPDGPAPVAQYDLDTKRLATVEAPADGLLGADQRMALVHELTHALQDQHFDLRAAEAAPAPRTAAALAEGDARRIQHRYRRSLDPSAAPAADTVAPPEGSSPTGTGDGVVRTLADVLAEPMVQTLVELDGQAALDGALRHLPLSEEALLDPGHYRGNGSVLVVAAPTPAAGETVLEEGTLGSLSWYLMLAEVTGPATALRAAYGWGGDRYLLVRDGEQTCLRLAYRAESRADLNEMKAAVESWIAAAPAVRREVSMLGDQLMVTGCDPGPAAPTPRAAYAAATLAAPALVIDTTRVLHLERRLPYEQARCASLDYLAQQSAESLALLATGADVPERSGQLDLAVRHCS